MIKRSITSIFGVALALIFGNMVSFAAVPGCDRHFTDADQDGFCDYCNSACQFADADGDGLCDSCGFDRHGMETACRSGYADADGDGLCDNCHAGRHTVNTGYTDADQDGICDYCHVAHSAGTGCSPRSSDSLRQDTAGSATATTGHHQSAHGSHHRQSGRHCH